MYTTTGAKVFEFVNIANQWLKKNPDNADTKLGYAIKKVIQQKLKDEFKRYDLGRKELTDGLRTFVEDCDIEFCETDAKGVVTYDYSTDQKGQQVKSYRFTKDNLRTRNKKLAEYRKEYAAKFEEYEALWDNETKVIDNYIATDIPRTLTEEEIEAFSGFVIPANYKEILINGIPDGKQCDYRKPKLEVVE